MTSELSPSTLLIDAIREQLVSIAPQISQFDACVVAFSGGMDSCVLLHALYALQDILPPIHAVHVHHGLSANADEWASQCESLARELNIPFKCYRVSLEQGSGQSIEALAREARYGVLMDYCRQHKGALFVGQHQDDQVETFLLQLKRGAGPNGLKAMQLLSYRQEVAVVRPMLPTPRNTIETYAKCNNLNWVEDESNFDATFDRNFLRHEVTPLLNARWPAFGKTVSRSADLCAEHSALLEEVTQEKLAVLTSDSSQLSITGLAEHSQLWQKQILRSWLSQCGAPLPSEAQLREVVAMITARQDSQPIVQFNNWQVRRFQQQLYAAEASAFETQTAIELETNQWFLPAFGYTLKISGTDLNLSQVPLSVKVKPDGSACSKPLKQWFQVWNVPPWQRPNCYLLSSANEVFAIALPDRIQAFENVPNRVTWQLHWQDGN